MGCFYSKSNIKDPIELDEIVIYSHRESMNDIKNINNNNNIFDIYEIPYEGEDKII